MRTLCAFLRRHGLDNWNEMRTAYKVAKLGTVSAAADALAVHRATVIRHIDSLEAELGSRLFLRHPRGYTTTDVGKDMLQVAAATDEQFTQLAGSTQGRSSEISGELIVTSVEIMSRFLLPALGRFREKYPRTSVRYLVDGKLYKLEYGEAHIAVRAGSKPDYPDNIARHFFTIRTGLYAHQDYVAKHGIPKSPDEFSRHIFVSSDRPNSGVAFRRWMQRNIPLENIALKSSSQRVERQALLSGLGIGFYPAHEAAQQGLVEVIAPVEQWNVDFWLVTHVDLHRSAKVQAFLAILKEDIATRL